MNEPYIESFAAEHHDSICIYVTFEVMIMAMCSKVFITLSN